MTIRKWLVLGVMIPVLCAAAFGFNGLEEVDCNPKPCGTKPGSPTPRGWQEFRMHQLDTDLKPQEIRDLAFHIESKSGLSHVTVQVVSQKGKVLYEASYQVGNKPAVTELVLAFDAEAAKAAGPYFMKGNSIRIVTKPDKGVTVRAGLRK